jgi:hypothetical protein
MRQWEPIAGKEVRVGDVISLYTEYEYSVLEIGKRKYRIEYDGNDLGWYPKSIFKFYSVGFKEYDPKQQPYTDDDI